MEKPNFEYIDKLARGDEEVKQTLLEVIKTEFPLEKIEYFESFNKSNFKETEENVHKIKHKISILGLENRYNLANNYEHNLREKSTTGSKDFELTLNIITDFIKTF